MHARTRTYTHTHTVFMEEDELGSDNTNRDREGQ